ncbi:TPA: hypothetical protein N0F65_005981 [Lagenidium giganteum]|uniref:Uncharacterized protein n=1 Tax=Lagenidium giganteum TaxID=4803 RepID=A0AAV2ZC70_9STRA|nr:TPA: hypothetical protein N0F65_005981 [Lagenidium giganteum]
MLRRLPAPINVVPSQTGPASSKTMETKKLNPIEPKVIDKKMDKKVDKKGKANPDQMTINVQAWPQPQHGPRRFTIAPLLVYSILFSSTATLQCAVLNFQFELRRLLRMDTLPVSMLLLVCWAVTGIATLAGGVVGDLVTDRVVLLRRSMPLWAAGLSGFQVASFKVPVPVYVFSLTCAFIWSWAAHGLFVGNAFLLATDDSSSSAVASASRPHLACCLAAMAMGSTLVQVVFFSLVDIRTLAPSADEGILNTSGVGFGCMLLLSVLLLATLVGFERRAWHYKPSRMDKLERKMALASRAVLGWRDMHQVYRHRGVRCVAVLAVCLLVLGVLLSFVSVFLNATPWKLAPFLLIVIGWLLALLMTKSLITPSEAVQTKCDDLGVPVRQMTRGFLTLVFVGIAAFAAFVRAQFYSTLLTQVCQTRLQFPGGHLRLDPRLLGALATTWSFVVLPMAEVWRTRYVHRHKPSLAWLAHSAHTPVDFRISTLLWLVGLFFASVVELYRRSSRHLAPPRDGNCGKMASVEFSFLWAVPHVLLLGAADACFRLSFHDELQALATRTTMPGLIHGLAALADTIGNASALAQASMLSSWLFRPEPTDLALLLLLTTAGAALAYSLLRRALAQAEDDDDDENHADECETP